MRPIIPAMSLVRRFNDVLQNRLEVLKRVFSAVKFHHIESVNFDSEIVINGIVLAIKGDGPLSVRELIPNKARLKDIGLNEFRNFPEHVRGVVVFDSLDPANPQSRTLQPTMLHAKILCSSPHLCDLLKFKAVWSVY